MSFDIIWSDPSFGEVQAQYATEAEAVEQALHDMRLGKNIDRIRESPSGNQIWSHDQLLNKMARDG